jgi:RNA polymerase sigma-70 factor (sigma-E family)
MASSFVADVWGGRAVAYVPYGDSSTAPRPDAAVAGSPDPTRTADRAHNALTIDAAWSADDAVTHLFASQYRPLVRLASLLLRDNGQAEEITQDAFVGLHAAWRRLRDPDKAVAYLRQSVVNRSRSALRHRGVVDRFLRRQGPSASEPSAEVHVLRAVDQAEMIDAVRALPARQREALVLRYYADLSEAQTAEAMGISQGAVKSHTARAIAGLRERLERPS